MNFFKKLEDLWKSQASARNQSSVTPNITLTPISVNPKVSTVGTNPPPEFSVNITEVNLIDGAAGSGLIRVPDLNRKFDTVSALNTNINQTDIINHIRGKNVKRISEKLKICLEDAKVIEEKLWPILAPKIKKDVDKVKIPSVVQFPEVPSLFENENIDQVQETPWKTTTSDRIIMTEEPYYSSASNSTSFKTP